MPDPVICLSCGLPVHDRTFDAPGDGPWCQCMPSDEAGAIRCPGCGAALRIGARGCPHCGSTVATTRCSECLAWNLAGAAHCQGCGRPLGDGAPRVPETTALQCPRCQSTLGARTYSTLSVNECDRCGGMFLSPETMHRIVAERDLPTGLTMALPQRSAVGDSEVHYVHCPVCARLMNRNAFGRVSGVVLDVCRKDGVWFDAGELFEVVRFIESGGLERARERELADMADEERRLHAETANAKSVVGLGTSDGLVIRNSATPGLSDLAVEIVDFFASLWR